MKRLLSIFLCVSTILILNCCTGRTSKPDPESRNYETGYASASTVTETEEDEPYIDNSLSTGEQPYECENVHGDESSIEIRTASNSECDVVVVVKSNGVMIGNAYIRAGGAYEFSIPNGKYQVFFYGGRGWNPDKVMPNGQNGGFVANESFSKDEPVTLNHQKLEYELIPQQNGNFNTEQSSASEVF